MKETKFKQTDIGLIPEDWMVENLGSLGSFCKGRGISRADANSGNIPAVRYGELYTMHDYYIKEFGSFISPQIAMESRRLKKGDIVFTCSGETKEDIGKSAAFVDDVEAYAGGDLIILSPYSQYNSLYLGFATNSKSCQEQKASKGQGDAVVHISAENIKTIQLAFPPTKEEQERIANALSQMDDLIAALDEQIKKKKLIKQGALQQLLTGKTRLKESSDYKMTELGMVPSDWSVKNVGELLKIGHGHDYKNLKSGNVPVYGTGGYMTSVNDFLYDGETVCIGRKGTIDKPFYHTGKIWTVDTLFYTYGFNGCIPKFIYYAFCLVDWLAMNEASGVPSLTSKNIEDVLLRVPSSEAEQAAIASTLSAMDDEIQTLQEERDKYVLVKQGMMQQLLTGKIRLN